jgi:hypothetical protein
VCKTDQGLTKTHCHMSILANAFSTTIRADGNPETPSYGLLQFALDLDAERRRLDRKALQAALETLQAEEGQE